MKLLILEALENLPEGLELEYEAIEGKIAISTDYADKEGFNVLDANVSDLVKKFEDKGYKVTYDNVANRKFQEILKHRRYTVLRKPKEAINVEVSNRK